MAWLSGRTGTILFSTTLTEDELSIVGVNDPDFYAVAKVGAPSKIAKYLTSAGSDRETIKIIKKTPATVKMAYFDMVEVPKDARGSGAGKRLVDLMLGELRNIGVEVVWLHAKDSVAFWRKFGFIDTGMGEFDMPSMVLWFRNVR